MQPWSTRNFPPTPTGSYRPSFELSRRDAARGLHPRCCRRCLRSCPCRTRLLNQRPAGDAYVSLGPVHRNCPRAATACEISRCVAISPIGLRCTPARSQHPAGRSVALNGNGCLMGDRGRHESNRHPSLAPGGGGRLLSLCGRRNVGNCHDPVSEAPYSAKPSSTDRNSANVVACGHVVTDASDRDVTGNSSNAMARLS